MTSFHSRLQISPIVCRVQVFKATDFCAVFCLVKVSSYVLKQLLGASYFGSITTYSSLSVIFQINCEAMLSERREASGKPLNSTHVNVKTKSSWTALFRRKSEERQQEKKVSVGLVCAISRCFSFILKVVI